MSKKIIYWVQGYRPQYEAISKEIKTLSQYFKKNGNEVTIHNLTFKNPFKYLFNNSYKSYFIGFYPFLIPFLSKIRCNINHIYTSLGDRPYLRVIRRKRTILTAAAMTPKEKIEKNKQYLKYVDKIVVECEREKNILLNLGIDENKIKLILPGVDIKKFSYLPNKNTFTVLFATSPPQMKFFEERGVDLLIEVAKELRDINFLFLWRKNCYRRLLKTIQKNKIKNIKIINKIIKNVNIIYSQIDCTIAPYLSQKLAKPVPRSLIESLASGKPVIVSNKVSIAKIIEKENVGIISESTKDGIIKAIIKLKENYERYQKNTINCAKKYFSNQKFCEEYNKLYKEMISKV